jgi:hypothetical protein
LFNRRSAIFCTLILPSLLKKIMNIKKCLADHCQGRTDKVVCVDWWPAFYHDQSQVRNTTHILSAAFHHDHTKVRKKPYRLHHDHTRVRKKPYRLHNGHTRVRKNLTVFTMIIQGWEKTLPSSPWSYKGEKKPHRLHHDHTRVRKNLTVFTMIIQGWEKNLTVFTMIIQGWEKTSPSSPWSYKGEKKTYRLHHDQLKVRKTHILSAARSRLLREIWGWRPVRGQNPSRARGHVTSFVMWPPLSVYIVHIPHVRGLRDLIPRSLRLITK